MCTLGNQRSFIWWLTRSFSCHSGDPQKSVQDQLPLIVGSASAGLVVIVALVVIAVVCLK